MAEAKGPLSDAAYQKALAALKRTAETDGLSALLGSRRGGADVALQWPGGSNRPGVGRSARRRLVADRRRRRNRRISQPDRARRVGAGIAGGYHLRRATQSSRTIAASGARVRARGQRPGAPALRRRLGHRFAQRRRYASVPSSQSWRGGLNTSTSRVSCGQRLVRQIRRNSQHLCRCARLIRARLPRPARNAAPRTGSVICSFSCAWRGASSPFLKFTCAIVSRSGADETPGQAALQGLGRRLAPLIVFFGR